MGRSFFLGTDAGLYAGSRNFSAKIGASPEAYGLTAALAAEYAALDGAYAAAYLAATTPETRTRAAVAAKNQAKIPLKKRASDLARIVDGTPGVSDAQRVELGLTVRAPRRPVGPPGTPTAFAVRLPGDGSLELSWKCKNPRGGQGTMYQVWRRAGGAEWVGEFEYLGGTGRRTFHDATLPAGSAGGQVTYRIQAVRSTAAGAWAEFNVNFGVNAGTGRRSPAPVAVPPGEAKRAA